MLFRGLPLVAILFRAAGSAMPSSICAVGQAVPKMEDVWPLAESQVRKPFCRMETVPLATRTSYPALQQPALDQDL
jgi:hypothetical protein